MRTLPLLLAVVATATAHRVDAGVEITSVIAYKHGPATARRTPLLRWRIDRVGAPARLYINCDVRNRSDSTEDVVILSHMDFVIAPTSQFRMEDIERLPSEVGWGVQAGLLDDVKVVRIPSLIPGEKRAVQLLGFDLRSLLKHYDGSADTLWPWWVRVHVRAESRDGKQLGSSSVSFALLPPRDRLRGRPDPPINRHPAIEPVQKR